ncbi:MAG TPA: alpha/beta hydrolase [Polyangiaceae bacterium]|nr:alpha/beta hydrolase [Polyangiaceae bacterium]
MSDSFSIPREAERFVPVPGGSLWSAMSGSGVPLVLFNGGPGCDDYLAPVARLIEDRCTVVRFEPRGCGRSTWDGKYDLDTLLSDADAIRDAYGFERWIVAGHSAGPNVALAYALRHPTRVLGVIGIAGGKVVDDRNWSETYHQRRAERGEDHGGKQYHADPAVNSQGNASWCEFCRRPSLLRELAALRAPCVFINAEQDIRPNWPTEQLAELISRARYVEISGAAHNIWLTHAAELGRELHAAVSYVLDDEGVH